MTWWNLTPASGVLDFDDGPELHLARVDGRLVAFWLDVRGRWLGLAAVGSA